MQAHALGLFFDEMVNTFDPDAFIVGGGALETGKPFQDWFIEQIRAGMPAQREEQAGHPHLCDAERRYCRRARRRHRSLETCPRRRPGVACFRQVSLWSQ